jgi:hypothetical protein
MARLARKAQSSRGPARGRSPAKRNSGGDAIALLKSDHREVEGLFAQFEKARSESKKKGLANKICNALRAHTTVEEEIFYPAFLEATGDKGTHHEAEVEHAGAKNLIAEIEASDPSDDYYDAKLKVLSEMIKHHVNEEEQRGGMFAEAKQSKMDLAELGAQLEQRKQELLLELNGDKPAKRGVATTLRDQPSGAPVHARHN